MESPVDGMVDGFAADPTFYRDALDNLYDGVYLVDRSRRIIYWNAAAERLTGYPAGEVIGRQCNRNLLRHVDEHGVDLCVQGCMLAKTMEDGQLREAEAYLHHRQGHRAPVRARVAPIRDGSGEIIGAVEVFSDNSWRDGYAEKVAQLEKLAMLDPLTGLANRRYLEMNLKSRIGEMERYGWRLGVLFSDVDHFKEVNDAYGHEVGDEALRMVARTLSANSRHFDLLGRWGGEEFVTVVVHAEEVGLRALAERLRALVEQSSLPVGAEEVRVTVSTGATLAEAGDSLSTLIRRADRLMYHSKASGRNRVSTLSDIRQALAS